MKNTSRAYCKSKKRAWKSPVLFFGGVVMMLVLFVVNLSFGSVDIPLGDVWTILTGSWKGDTNFSYIIFESRLPQAVTAILCGSSLSLCGLLLQTLFKNPLAGPSVLGISSGSCLGVAIVLFILDRFIALETGLIGQFPVVFLGAMVGALGVVALLYVISLYISRTTPLLIIGVVLGYLFSSFISLLNFFAPNELVKTYFLWGMGSFSQVPSALLALYISCTLPLFLLAFVFSSSLDTLLVGDILARSMGVSVSRLRRGLILLTGLLTALSTAFCGPIAFIGLSVPHLSRYLLCTQRHQILIPFTLILGAVTAQFCLFLSIMPGLYGVLPINVITPLIGIPVLLHLLLCGIAK